MISGVSSNKATVFKAPSPPTKAASTAAAAEASAGVASKDFTPARQVVVEPVPFKVEKASGGSL